MDETKKEQLVMDGHLASEPQVGRWLWALQDTRRRTMRALRGLEQEMVDWLPQGADSSIGTLLYHIADIEADWLYVEVLEQPFPGAVAALFPHGTRDDQGQLSQVRGDTLEQHLHRLETVRTLLLDAYAGMDLDEFRRARAFEPYDVTPEYVLHHLMQHEAEHRSQIGWLRARWKSG